MFVCLIFAAATKKAESGESAPAAAGAGGSSSVDRPAAAPRRDHRSNSQDRAAAVDRDDKKGSDNIGKESRQPVRASAAPANAGRAPPLDRAGQSNHGGSGHAGTADDRPPLAPAGSRNDRPGAEAAQATARHKRGRDDDGLHAAREDSNPYRAAPVATKAFDRDAQKDSAASPAAAVPSDARRDNPASGKGGAAQKSQAEPRDSKEQQQLEPGEEPRQSEPSNAVAADGLKRSNSRFGPGNQSNSSSSGGGGPSDNRCLLICIYIEDICSRLPCHAVLYVFQGLRWKQRWPRQQRTRQVRLRPRGARPRSSSCSRRKRRRVRAECRRTRSSIASAV